MELDLEQLFSCKKINESTLKLYLKNLSKLNNKLPIKNLKFLDNIDDINNKLDKYKPNTRRSFIISIVSLLKCVNDTVNDKKYKLLYDKYFKILTQMNIDLKDQTKMTPSEVTNWITKEQLDDKFNQLYEIINEIGTKKKITEEQYNKLLNLLVFSLYYLNEPRRNVDYQLLKYKLDDNKDYNYINMKTKQFIFNKFKTSNTYNTQIVDINDKLFEIIKLFLKFNKNEDNYLLSKYDGSNFKNINDITNLLNKIFNKKIGSSMLRKLYISNKYGNLNEELKKDAEAMGTSSSTLQSNYIKQQ
jgi:hypothetical protein